VPGEGINRTVAYRRHEFRYEPEGREAPLWAFLFDIPYLGACGIFPPLHLLNQLLGLGGGDGGMGPGASWAPFEIGPADYAALVPAVLNPDRRRLSALARYHDQEFALDPAFDHQTDYFEWLRVVCEKHREAYHAKRTRRSRRR
jgi:hypothetical protein